MMQEKAGMIYKEIAMRYFQMLNARPAEEVATEVMIDEIMMRDFYGIERYANMEFSIRLTVSALKLWFREHKNINLDEGESLADIIILSQNQKGHKALCQNHQSARFISD